MGKSFVDLDKVVLSKMGTDGVTNPQNMGLRYPAKLTIEDVPITVERNRAVRNFVRFMMECETINCDWAMLQDFITVFCVDEMTDGHFVTAPQQAADDARAAGLKGAEVFNFTDSAAADASNNFLGFNFRYVEEFSESTRKISCFVKSMVELEKQDADAILDAVLTNTSTPTDGESLSKKQNLNLKEILFQNDGYEFKLRDLVSYKLELESVGDGSTLHGRPNIDYIRVNLEIVSKSSGVDKFQDLGDEADSFFGSDNLQITTQQDASTDIIKSFAGHYISMINTLEIGKQRFIKLNITGDVPVLKVAFTSNATSKTITFGS